MRCGLHDGDVPVNRTIIYARLTDIQISNDAALLELADRATSLGILTGKIFIDTSTVHPDTSKAVEAKLQNKGASFVASPVFGASLQAKTGQLIFAMAGPKATIDFLRPYIVGVMGKSIIDCGEDVSMSSLMKISGYVAVYSRPGSIFTDLR